MNVCVLITVTTVWWSFAAKVLQALWDNIVTIALVMLLKEALMFHTLLCGKGSLTQKTFH
jgi:hypothetical protein